VQHWCCKHLRGTLGACAVSMGLALQPNPSFIFELKIVSVHINKRSAANSLVTLWLSTGLKGALDMGILASL